MKIYIGKDKADMAARAAKMAGDRVRAAIAARGEARIIVATGASQFEFLDPESASMLDNAPGTSGLNML